MDTLGELIKEARKKKGLTTTQLAEKVDISQGYISHLENNRKKNPSPDILKKLSETLDVPYVELMEKAGYIRKIELKVDKNVKSDNELSEEELKAALNKLKEFFKGIQKKINNTYRSNNSHSSLTKKLAFELNEKLELLDELSSELKENIDITEMQRLSKEVEHIILQLQVALIEDIEQTKQEAKELEDILKSPIEINGKALTDTQKEKLYFIAKAMFSDNTQ